ncbi:beta-phosphoglucomutase [Paucilactobacillus hokkaidonensis JCM 18461]|uniref:Beta-phosphoglucomutase n=2 Tax=Paucilactobacillus hokkaidonensis TaxID=1193095 RepID=A0A0A1H0G3_9LACO|nr:beta-phosphoglucomutase [Paucilactobacillus hokkaidonensis]KRO10437.1 beta-phosphoglucomutase [Paucilactobacillus hokkaidonensis]BAP86754.1 beta-phosphoglucomutase [Paucilactobacillus hokkaidonensis JCM 18461]
MQFNNIKGFAFDLDGVIADTARFHGQAWHQTADEVGTVWTDELAENLKGISRMDSLELILNAGGYGQKYTTAQKETLATQKNDKYLELIKTLTPADILPGMKKFLDELKDQQYHLSVASASKNAPTILKQLKLTDYFDGIVDPATLHAGKPDPEIFVKAAEVMGLDPVNVAGLEDSSAGITSINSAGELSIGIGSQLNEAKIKFAVTDEVSLVAIKTQLIG